MTYTDNGVAKEAVTEYYYDGNGNLIKMVDANNTPLPPAEQKAFVYTYSATDLVLSETDPAGNSTTYTYDKAGNRTSMTDPRGGRYDGDFTIIYEYDDLNRLVAGYLPKSPGETEKPVVRLVYDARGNLLERVEPDGGRTKPPPSKGVEKPMSPGITMIKSGTRSGPSTPAVTRPAGSTMPSPGWSRSFTRPGKVDPVVKTISLRF
jgi:YD repeat-containing protein